jgi:hypothetical protein
VKLIGILLVVCFRRKHEVRTTLRKETVNRPTRTSRSSTPAVVLTQRWALNLEEIDAFADRLKRLIKTIDVI